MRAEYRLSRAAVQTLMALGELAGNPPLPVSMRALAAFLGVSSAWRSVGALCKAQLARGPGVLCPGISLTPDGLLCYRLMRRHPSPRERRRVASAFLNERSGGG